MKVRYLYLEDGLKPAPWFLEAPVFTRHKAPKLFGLSAAFSAPAHAMPRAFVEHMPSIHVGFGSLRTVFVLYTREQVKHLPRRVIGELRHEAQRVERSDIRRGLCPKCGTPAIRDLKWCVFHVPNEQYAAWLRANREPKRGGKLEAFASLLPKRT